ncbi:outer membrane beta-barrel protein [Zhongshania sp.]|jgi:opacity protein-like surface antigen|uniref:outer membrane beta-barrel protein n=1 Tax=Zhongshania sp. TaxID=1971902 RepID=UPI0039E3734E
MKTLPILTLAIISLLPTLAEADHQQRRSHSSYRSEPAIYIFGGVSTSSFNFDRSDFRYSFGDGSLSDVTVDTESGGARFGFGFDFTPELSLELGYASLGTLTGSGISDGSQFLNNGFSAGRVDMDASADGVFLGVNVHTPHNQPVGLFARFGIYGWELDGTLEDNSRSGQFTVEGSDPYAGIGLRLAVAENISVVLAYDYYVLDDDESINISADTLSVDMVFRF